MPPLCQGLPDARMLAAEDVLHDRESKYVAEVFYFLALCSPMTIENKPTELRKTPHYAASYFVPELNKYWAEWYSRLSGDDVGDFENVEWWRTSFGEPESIASWESVSSHEFPEGEVMRVDFEAMGFLASRREVSIIGSVEYYYQPTDENEPPKIICSIVDAQQRL